MSRRQSWNTILVFCILIFGMTIATMLKPSTEFSETENRSLAQKPSFSIKTLLNGEFESDYEKNIPVHLPQIRQNRISAFCSSL